MAGAGFKVFNTGDVLTASDVNTFLQQQTVMVFASSAARTSALSGVLAEGMVTYLQDTNSVQVYNGTAFVAVGGSSPLTTKGDLYTFSTVDERLPVGTNGQVLTADSSEATGLKFATPAGGGGMTLIETLSLTGSASVTSSSISGTFEDLVIYGRGITCGSNVNVGMRFNSDTGSNYTQRGLTLNNTTVSGGQDANSNQIDPIALANPSTDYNRMGQFNFVIPRYSKTEYKFFNYFGFGHAVSISEINSRIGFTGSWDNTAAITTITVRASANFTAGSVYIYGVK